MNRFHLLFLTLVILLASCTKYITEYVPSETPPVPEGESIEVPFKIFGAPQDAPVVKSRAIADDGAISALTAYIFTQSGQNYIFHSSRPVVSNGGTNYKVLLPSSLLNQNLRVHFYANSALITNGKTFTVGTLESVVRTSLTVKTTNKWQDVSTTIPMYGSKDFTFTQTPAVGNVMLRRMLARVDVGVAYPTGGNPTENQVAAGLDYFKLKQVRVMQTNGSGSLIYATNNVVEIPANPGTIGPYTVPVGLTDKSSQKEIYLFEHKAATPTVWVKERACILIQGAYTAPDKTTTMGWYRLDFTNNDNVNPTYIDILRNNLYRFNITSVTAPGFGTDLEALDNRPANVTFKLDAFTVNQDDIVFDGQNYLSVDRSVLNVYRNTTSTTLSIETSAPKGWTLEYGTSGLNASHFSPSSVTAGSTTPMLVTVKIPNYVAKRTFFIKAGNLRKQIDIVAENIDAPTDGISNFSIPEALYFAMKGGTQPLVVTSNIKLAEYTPYQGPTMGKITSTAKGVNAGGFHYADVNVAQITTANTAIKQYEGAVGVKVRSINGEITAKTKIVQFANELTSTVTVTPAGVLPWNAWEFRAVVSGQGINDFVHKLSLPFAAEADRERFMQSKDAGGANFTFSANRAPNNTSYAARQVGTIESYPASDYKGPSTTTSLLKPLMLENVPGHTRPTPIAVMQAGKPKPEFEVSDIVLPYVAKTFSVTMTPTNGTTVVANEISNYRFSLWDNIKYVATGPTNTNTYTATSEATLISNRGSLDPNHLTCIYSATGFGGEKVGSGSTQIKMEAPRPLDLTKIAITQHGNNGVEIQSFAREADGRVVLRLYAAPNINRYCQFEFSNLDEAGVYQVPFVPALDANWELGHTETRQIENIGNSSAEVAFRGSGGTTTNLPNEIGVPRETIYVNTGAPARDGNMAYKQYRMKVEPQYKGTPAADCYLYIYYLQQLAAPASLALSESTNGVHSDVIKGVVGYGGGTKRIYVSSPNARWTLSLVSGTAKDITFSYPNGNGGAKGNNIPVDVRIAKNTEDGRGFQFRVTAIPEGLVSESSRTMRLVQDFNDTPFHPIPLYSSILGGDIYNRILFVEKDPIGSVATRDEGIARCRNKSTTFTDAAGVWRMPANYDDVRGFAFEGNNNMDGIYAKSSYGFPTRDFNGTDGLWVADGKLMANFFATTDGYWMMNLRNVNVNQKHHVRCIMTRHRQRPL